MPLKLAHIPEKMFPLDEELVKLDYPAEDVKDTYVTIKQATRRETEALAELTAEQVRSWNAAGTEIREIFRFSIPEHQRIEAMLTMVDCNILDPNGEPLFRFKKQKNGELVLSMNSDEFKSVWGKLDDRVANLIHNKVRKMNPQWGPQGEA